MAKSKENGGQIKVERDLERYRGGDWEAGELRCSYMLCACEFCADAQFWDSFS